MQQIAIMLRQRWIPAVFVLGFLVVVAVNATLIVTAVGSFSGLVVAHPYKKGSEYTRVHAALEQQKALAWRYHIASDATADGRLRLSVQWTEASGLPLSGLVVTAEFGRPVENMPPLRLDLAAQGGGRYGAIVDLPRPGLWDLRLVAAQGERQFVAAERLQVPE
jgi:nitrogen fixation protein FixH